MATVTTDPLEALEQSWFEPPGLISWFTTVDHKRIGMKYLVTALAFFVFGGIESLILRAQLGGPELHLISPEAYSLVSHILERHRAGLPIPIEELLTEEDLQVFALERAGN